MNWGSRATKAAYAALLLVVLTVIFRQNERCLLFGLDGTSWIIEFKAQAARAPFSQVGVDPLQGSFDAYYPALREYFFPEALALLFTGSGAGKTFTYVAYSMLMAFSTGLLARAVGFSPALGFFSAMLVPALALPTNLTGESWLYGIYNLIPHLAQITSLTMLIIACFWAMDFRRPIMCVLLGFLAIGSVVFSAASFVTMTILMVPTIAVYAGASIFTSRNAADILTRVCTAVGCIAVPAALGMVHYALAVGGYTAYNFFDQEFMQSRASLGYASIFYNNGLGKLIIILSVIGGFYTAFTGPKKVRIFSWTHIVATISFQIIALTTVVFAEGYHGPSPLYFEFMTWPIMLMFCASLAYAVIERSLKTLKPGFNRDQNGACSAAKHIAFAAVPVFLIFWNSSVALSRTPSMCAGTPFFPIRSTPVSDHLQQGIATQMGAPFRGLAATFTEVDNKTSVDWFALHGGDGELWRKIGNDLRLVGLWWYNIPTLFDYSPLISPPYYLLLTEFLARPADKQLRSVVVLTKPDERMLKLWGVRFLIADFDPEFGRIVITMPVPGQDSIRLVEIPNANLGDYSPTDLRQVNSFAQGLHAMHEANFDGQQTVVTEKPLQGPFVAAQGARLVYEKSGFSVTASSAGHSLLVLPVQYSKCWTVSGEGSPLLFRANMMQLGIYFTGHLDARLRFRFGPLFASQCRLKDIKDMDELHIRDARVR